MHKKRLDSVNARCISIPFCKRKQGQVTIFIILGIVLIILLLLFVFLREEIFSIAPGKIIPQAKDKIEKRITSCLTEVGEQALFTIGLQGGYLEFSAEQLRDGNYLLQTPVNPVPYWGYGETLEIPSLDSIKHNLDIYIQQNIESCVFPTGLADEEYTYVSAQLKKSDTEFTNNKVLFNLDWEINVQTKDGELVSTLINHQSESPIKFKSVYDTAVDVTKAEMSMLKFEDITQDLIALEHPQVPVQGIEISCSEKKWFIPTVQDTLKELVRANIPQIKIKGTNIINFPENLPYYQNHYIWEIADDFGKEDINVEFRYEPNWPFAFQVTPTDGSYLRSGTQGGSSDILSKVCIQMWKFTYDVTYPVIMKVRDSSGYTFNTGFTVHLTRNNPSRENVVNAFNPSSVPTIPGEEYCSNRRIPMTIKTTAVIDSPETGVSYSEPVTGINISFTCVKHRCEMGTTEQQVFGSGFTRNFPYCVGGIIRAEKKGFKESWQRVLTEHGKEIEVELTPLVTVQQSNVQIKLHEVKKENNQYQIGALLSLNEKDLVMISLKSNKKDHSGKPFHESTMVTSSSGLTVEGFGELEFLAGTDFTYDTDIKVFRNDLFVGGYQGNWTVPWNKLIQAEELTFHLGFQEGTAEESFELISTLPKITQELPLPEIR